MEKFRLSIFSFDTLERASFRIPLAAMVALLLVLACEGSLHLFKNQLPEPLLWGEGGASVKVALVQHEALKNDSAVDILILGPSHASVGISPKVLLRSIGDSKLRAFNGALKGRTYTTMSFLYKEIYKPILKPKILVLAVSPLLLNSYNKRWERNSLEFLESPMPKALSASGISKVWRLFVTENVFLYKYRHRSYKGWLNGKRNIDKYGFRPLTGEYNASKRQEILKKTHPYKKIMSKFEFGGPSLDALIRLIEDAGKSKMSTLVVNMPFRKELLSLGAEGHSDYEQYLKKMESLSSNYNFVWIDYQSKLVFDDSDFYDVDHLNTKGAKKLSKQIAMDITVFL